MFFTAYINYVYNYNNNQNVLRVFLFIYVFNNFVKFYGYCRFICLKVPTFRVTLAPKLFFCSQFFGLITLLQFYSITYFIYSCRYNSTSYHAYNCMLTKNFLKLYLCSIIKLPKIPKVNIFLFLSITILLSWCGEIETKILTFCPRNLNGLTAHDSIKLLVL